VTPRIDSQIENRQHIIFRRQRCGCFPAKHRFDARNQHFGAEGFDDVIFGTEFEAGHDVALFSPRGHHNHRDIPHRFVLFQFAADLHPVFTGKHEVEKNEVGLFLRDEFQTLLAAFGLHNAEVFAREVITNQLANVFFVFDDQNAVFHDSVSKGWNFSTVFFQALEATALHFSASRSESIQFRHYQLMRSPVVTPQPL